MSQMYSDSSKKLKDDTRSNWLMFMFPSKCRYNVFRKQSTINACQTGFQELERFGFEFGPFGFSGTHVHLAVNVPQKYSVLNSKTMLKKYSAQRVFQEKPNFRKLYPRGHFWSRYEHHHGFGADQAKALQYIADQQRHHNVQVINDVA